METLTELRTRLRARADTLEVTERQKILRLLVHEISDGSRCRYREVDGAF